MNPGLLLCLDACLRPINYSIVAIGSLRQLQMPIANVFKVAILSNAAFIVLAHNHPSGDPEPSDEDLENTRKAKEIGEILGIPLLEHLVIGEDGYVSILSSDVTKAPLVHNWIRGVLSYKCQL